MRITSFTTVQKTNAILYSAEVWMNGEKKPQTLYFLIEKKWKNALYMDASPFVATMLIPAMKKGEGIEIVGNTVSTLFLSHLDLLQKQLNRWNKEFKKIAIVAKVKPDTKKKGELGEFFTGGVDSFYTYLKLKKQKKKVQNFLFVHGFDIELENTSFFKSVKKSIEKIGEEEGVRTITLQTNAKKIVEKYIEWDWGHGGALAGVALLLRNKISHVYIAGALRHDQLFPYGTHPKIDPLWGTERLILTHDGNEYDRLDKVTHVVGKSPLALKHLRVCNQNLKGKYNCSHCFKCLWTMMTLECADALRRSQTFDHEIDLEAVKRMRYTFERNYHLAGKRVIGHLRKEKRRKDLIEAVEISLKRSKDLSLQRKVAEKIAALDKKYNKRRLYNSIFAVNERQDRGHLFKLLSSQGIIK